MPFEWDKTKAAALKILGKDGDVPDPPANLLKAVDSVKSTDDNFNKGREDLEAKILAMQNANDATKNSLKQFQASLTKSDYGLDPKNKDDAKKIEQARKIILDRLTVGFKRVADNEKFLDELDKHLIQLSKYKSPPV